MEDDAPGISIVGGDVPDVFADEALDFDIVNGTLRIRFGVAKRAGSTMPSDQQLVHIGRQIMPLESGQRLAIGLYDMLKNAGYDPASALSSAGTGSLN